MRLSITSGSHGWLSGLGGRSRMTFKVKRRKEKRSSDHERDGQEEVKRPHWDLPRVEELEVVALACKSLEVAAVLEVDLELL